jgi:hypothetical protein
MIELYVHTSPGLPKRKKIDAEQHPKLAHAMQELAELESIGQSYADAIANIQTKWISIGPDRWLIPADFEKSQLLDLIRSSLQTFEAVNYRGIVEDIASAAIAELERPESIARSIPTLSEVQFSIVPQVAIAVFSGSDDDEDFEEGIEAFIPIDEHQWAADVVVRSWLDNPGKLINGRKLGDASSLKFPGGLTFKFPGGLTELLADKVAALPSDRKPWLQEIYRLSQEWDQLAPLGLILHQYEPSEVDELKKEMRDAMENGNMDAVVLLANRIKLLTTEQSSPADCDPTDVGGCVEAEAKLCDSLNDASSDSVGTEDEEIDEDGDEIEATIDSEPDEF